MTTGKMQRVTRKTLCPVCGKPDWCLVTEDGSAAICARIEQDSVKRCGDAGWLHILSNDYRRGTWPKVLSRRISTGAGTDKGFEQLTQRYQKELTQENLTTLSEALGVSAESLRRLRTGWDGQAYTFPMTDSEGRTIGIRRRFPDARKVSVTGSRTGLFVPVDMPAEGLLLIVEGESDLAAALTLGFAAVGRPNCSSKVELTARAAQGWPEIVIVSDNDSPGRNGAEKLAEALTLYCRSVRIVYPPDGIKDLRQWLACGLSRSTLLQVISNTRAIQIGISTGTET